MMRFLRYGAALLVLVTLGLSSTIEVMAVAPHPDLVEKWKAEGVLEEKLAALRAFKAAGGCSPEIHTPISKDRSGKPLALGSDLIDSAFAIVILVEFADNLMSSGAVNASKGDFDSVLFSEGHINPTGSMTDFYLENSYGNFVVTGDIFGPYMMPLSYAWYVDGDNHGLTRASILVEDAIDSVAPYVPNWAKYDSNDDGYCDGLIIVHAGLGAEGSGSGIWSHKGNIPTITLDGVKLSAYTMNPEEFSGEISPIGVFCHEYGHFLGLPDLYDISGVSGSMGVGNWAVMATGSYNGGSKIPSSFTAWSKAEIGFLVYDTTDVNLSAVEFPCSEYTPFAYRLQNDLSTYYEFWVVENRQPYGFDAALPGYGLCVYHVDRNAPGPSNQNPAWYHVAVEQADGDNALAYSGSRGDGGDVFPGSSNAREFHDLSNPNTHTNLLGPFNNDATTRIGLWNISDPDSIMTVDIDEDWSRPWPLLAAHDSIMFLDTPPGGDGDGVLEPGETIKVYVTMKNAMRTSFNATLSFEGANPAVTLLTDNVLLAAVFDETEMSNLTPIEFRLASAFTPVIDSFQLVVTCDSTGSEPYSSPFSRSFGVELTLGPSQVLIVDDDRGKSYEEVYVGAMYAERIPHTIWHKAGKGSPTGDDLKKFRMVFWHTGDSAQNIFTADDVAAMTEYLDAGGNLLLSSISGAKALNDLNPTFLQDYLGANWSGNLLWPFFDGVAGNQLGDGTKYRYLPTVPVNSGLDLVTTVGSGQAAFKLGGRSEVCGITKQGLYNSVFVTFPIEYLADQFAAYNTKQELFARVLDFFGGIPLGVDDGSPHAALPSNFDLHQNYPNPFNPSTTISYTLRPTSGQLPQTTLSIYNLLGQRVITLVDKVQLPGTYQVQWDGRSEAGGAVASGVYFYRLSRGGDTQSRKMVLLK